MALLNKITLERMRAAALLEAEWLEVLLQSPARSVREEDNAGRLALNLGFYHHVLDENSSTSRDYFVRAAAHCALALARRAAPGASEHRNIYDAELYLNAIGVFGSAHERRLCADLTRSQVSAPEHACDDAMAAYVGVLARHLGGAAPDQTTLDRVVQLCERVQASRLDRRYLLPSATGLLAVARKDAGAFNLAIAQLLSAHTQEAQKGDLRLLPQGLICMRAMMLAQCGRDAGLACSVASPYLPQQLLRQD